MQNNIFKLILFIVFIIITIITNSIYFYPILITLTALIVLMSNIDIKEILRYLLKIKYLYLLIILVPFFPIILSILIKITIIYLMYICYINTTSLAKRYNTLYPIFKIFNLEKYTINFLLFIPLFYKELKNIKLMSLKNIINNVLNKIKIKSSRFIGFEFQKQSLGSIDYTLMLIIVLFFIIFIAR